MKKRNRGLARLFIVSILIFLGAPITLLGAEEKSHSEGAPTHAKAGEAKPTEKNPTEKHLTEKHVPEKHVTEKHVTEKKTPKNVDVPLCGVLDSFSGDVQVLDPSRERLISLSLKTALPCGSWVATNQGGWAQLRHETGPIVMMGPDTLVQLLQFTPETSAALTEKLADPTSTQTSMNDHLTLYKGEVYAEVGGGMGEFRIVSPTGRVRLDHARVIVAFTQEEDKTQLISIEDRASLENRFEPSRKISVRSGEITELDFKLMRVMPLLPQPVSSASLHPMLVELRVSEREQTIAEAAINKARNRRLAGLPPKGDHVVRTQESYMRHASDAEDMQLRSRWVRKLAGGDPGAEKVLYPEKDSGRLRKVKVEVTDVETRFKKQGQKAEQLEKQKIMHELSQIRVE